jgi:hypothetical protein
MRLMRHRACALRLRVLRCAAHRVRRLRRLRDPTLLELTAMKALQQLQLETSIKYVEGRPYMLPADKLSVRDKVSSTTLFCWPRCMHRTTVCSV